MRQVFWWLLLVVGSLHLLPHSPAKVSSLSPEKADEGEGHIPHCHLESPGWCRWAGLFLCPIQLRNPSVFCSWRPGTQPGPQAVGFPCMRGTLFPGRRYITALGSLPGGSGGQWPGCALGEWPWPGNSPDSHRQHQLEPGEHLMFAGGFSVCSVTSGLGMSKLAVARKGAQRSLRAQRTPESALPARLGSAGMAPVHLSTCWGPTCPFENVT